ncbi:hypothetical protein ACFT2C_05160 [Promicromonospora sp. NPDC057138]|uniref:hypothetical protein n=1 Tax=Promicromonospora sp. NPDC057138 TaxID=3346031 RepID=UPI00362E46AB
MEIDPVEDPAELAEIAKCEEQIPLAEFDHAQALRREGEPQAYGFTVGSGPRPGKGERLRNLEANKMNKVSGQAQRVLLMLCNRAHYGTFAHRQPCEAIVAKWNHVVGGRRSADGPRAVSKAEWDQRRKAWGEAVEPWCGWLVDAVSGKKYRDYQDGDGHVTVSCPNCGRQDIRVDLRRVQEELVASTEAKTLRILI